jgi:hypothetical protein
MPSARAFGVTSSPDVTQPVPTAVVELGCALGPLVSGAVYGRGIRSEARSVTGPDLWDSLSANPVV